MRFCILFTVFLPLTGCKQSPDGQKAFQQAPDGRKAFLESELALDKVQALRIRLDGIGGREVTDGEFACDKDVSHWTTVDKPESQKVEYVQTSDRLFVRFLEPQLGAWRMRKQDSTQGVCNRLKYPAEQTSGDDRRMTIDQQRSLPPLSAYANETGARITSRGTETVAGVACDVWDVQDLMRSPSYMRQHTVWIGTEDHLPRKYVEGDPDNPDAIVTYFDYNQPIEIAIPSVDYAH